MKTSRVSVQLRRHIVVAVVGVVVFVVVAVDVAVVATVFVLAVADDVAASVCR